MSFFYSHFFGVLRIAIENQLHIWNTEKIVSETCDFHAKILIRISDLI